MKKTTTKSGPRSSFRRSYRPSFEQLEARRLLAVDWRNPADNIDVNADGDLAPIDVLNVINYLNRNGTGTLPTTKPTDALFVDVNGDNEAAPIDVLQVINALQRNGVGQRVLQEATQRFSSEQFITITTGQSVGRRLYELKVEPSWDTSANSSLVPDVFSVYVVNSDSDSKTLLNRSVDGTAIFSLSKSRADIVPGISDWNGSVLTIDLSTVVTTETATLKLQLLGQGDTQGSRIRLKPLANFVDGEEEPTASRASVKSLKTSGSSTDLSTFNVSSSVTPFVDNIRYDHRVGELKAEVSLDNLGSAIGRQVAFVFPNLPTGVVLESASGLDSLNRPYVNFYDAIPSGGLGKNDSSSSILFTFKNVPESPFTIEPIVLVGPPNRAPVFDDISPINITPGAHVEIGLVATDADADKLSFFLNPDGRLPQVEFSNNGKLKIQPTPNDIGSYQAEIIVSDGVLSTTKKLVINVVADSVRTTRISGKVLDVDGSPLSGIRVDVGNVQALTVADGGFKIDLGEGVPAADTIKIRGELFSGTQKYPFIAEKLALLLEHDVFPNATNEIFRPIYLPKLNAGAVVSPTTSSTISQQLRSGELPVQVTVAANTLFSQQGAPFTGELSITEVPIDRTPAAFPSNLVTDLIVTIQPGEMTFATPAPLTFPNRLGFPAGTILDLWSINPVTGQFDDVGAMRVSTDLTKIETISGGIRNSSWHTPVLRPKDPRDETDQKKCGEEDKECAASSIGIFSGSHVVSHQFSGVSSLGKANNASITYDSLRASPDSAVRFSFDVETEIIRGRPPFNLAQSVYKLFANVELVGDGWKTTIEDNGRPLTWLMDGAESGKRVAATVPLNLRNQRNGVYKYIINSGLAVSGPGGSSSSMVSTAGTLVNVGTRKSTFGVGWGVSGLQSLTRYKSFSSISTNALGAESEDADSKDPVLLMDGDGSELLFQPGPTPGTFVSPVGDFSVLSKTADGRFLRRFKDGMVSEFDANLRLQTTTDAVGNRTSYIYETDGLLRKMIDPIGQETLYEYTNTKLTKITFPDGRFSTMTFDADGHLTSMTDPDGSTKRFEYNSRGLMTAEIDERGQRTISRYDEFGKLLEAIRPDGSRQFFDVVESRGIWFGPDSQADVRFEQLATFVSPAGRSTYRTSTREGHTLSSRDDVGRIISISRNQSNLPIQFIDAEGNPRSMKYDDKGNLIETQQFLSVEENITPIATDGFSFPGRVIFPGGPFPPFPNDVALDAAASDVNNDGKNDIVSLDITTTNGTDKVLILTNFGDGVGSFKLAIGTVGPQVSQKPLALAVGDIDRDGFVDVVTSNGATLGTLSVFRGKGDGSFELRETIGGGLGKSNRLLLKDVNNDGRLDIVAGLSGDTSISIATNANNFTFNPATSIGSLAAYLNLAIAELNNDAFPEIILLNDAQSTVTILSGDIDASFSQRGQISVPGGPRDFTIADFNQDGNLDAAFGLSSPTGVTIYRGDGQRGLTLNQTLAVASTATLINAIDFRSDGKLDIIVNQSNGRVTTFVNNGNEFVFNNSFVLAGIPTKSFVTNWTTGGEPQLLRVLNGIQMFSATSLLGSGPYPFVATTQTPTTPVIGDFNGDGIPDIATTVSSQSNLIRLFGNGNEFSTPIVTGGLPSTAIKAADFNGDGRSDLLAFGSRALSIIHSDEDGNPGTVQSIDSSISPSNSRGIEIANLNSDTVPDFVVAGKRDVPGQPSIEVLNVYLSNGQGGYTRQVLVTDPSKSAVPKLGDLDGDGDLDLITAVLVPGTGGTNLASYSIVRYFNIGNGLFGPSFTVQANLVGPGFFQVADFNKDGLADLALHTAPADVISIYDNRGIGTFLSTADRRYQETENSLNSLSVADVNNDGNLDILSTDANSNGTFNGVTIYLSPGVSGQPLQRSRYRLPTRIVGVATADLNLDGRTDLVLSSNSANGFYLFGMNSLNRIGAITERFEYESNFSQLTKHSDPLGRETLYDIDPANGLTKSMTYADGTKVSFAYDAHGLVSSMTDQRGRTTSYTRDTRGNLLTKSSNGRMEAYEYDNAGNVTAYTDANNNRSVMTYDAKRRLTSIRDGLGNLSEFKYDLIGNLIEIKDALGRKTVHEYDNRDRRIQTTDSIGNITKYGYDLDGNVTSVTDPNGNTTRYRYDARSRRVETIDPDGGRTKFRYDGNNNIARIIDPVGNITVFAYDARNLLISEIDPLGKQTLYEYDANSNLVKKTDRLGRVTRFEYDLLDRLTKEVWENGGNAITYSYDAKGNVLSIVDSFSSLTYNNDALDRVKTVDNFGTPGASRVILTYEYDTVGNVLSVTDSINGTTAAATSMAYDALNRVKQIKQAGAIVTEKRVDYSFNALSQLTSIGRFSDLAGTQTVANTSYSFDSLNRLSLINHTNASGTTLESFGYNYDPASRITRITEKNQTIDYGYDKRDQLVSTNYGDAARTDEAFKFDANGNRVESNAHGTAYRTGPGNRLTTDGVYNYEYDAEGNRTKRTEIATGKIQEYQWDHRNRLTMLSDKNASGVLLQVVRYSYDSLGRRISKQVDTTPLDTVDAAIEQYVYDGEDVILDFVDPDGSGPVTSQQTTRYLRGPGIDNLLAIETASGTNWVLQDHLGSTRALVSSAGVLVQSIDYDSFGKPIVDNAPQTRYLFTGREFEDESDLYYYRARYFDATIGRFVAEDPIGFWGGDANLVRYGNNRPSDARDPSGHSIYLDTHPVGAGANHSKITIIPDNQIRYANNPAFTNVLADGRRYATIGAGPTDGILRGKLRSDLNRDKDVNRNNNNPGSKHLNPQVCAPAEDQLIDDLFRLDENYPDDLPYEFYPDSDSAGYNSNSYIAGLLRAAGFSVASPISVPGLTKPVPGNKF